MPNRKEDAAVSQTLSATRIICSGCWPSASHPAFHTVHHPQNAPQQPAAFQAISWRWLRSPAQLQPIQKRRQAGQVQRRALFSVLTHGQRALERACAPRAAASNPTHQPSTRCLATTIALCSWPLPQQVNPVPRPHQGLTARRPSTRATAERRRGAPAPRQVSMCWPLVVVGAYSRRGAGTGQCTPHRRCAADRLLLRNARHSTAVSCQQQRVRAT